MLHASLRIPFCNPASRRISCFNGCFSTLREAKMLRRIFQAIASWFGFDRPAEKKRATPSQEYSLQIFDDRSSAATAATRPGVVALVRGGGKEKWLLMKCPCGCGSQIALNLMQSHSPRWTVAVQSPTRFSVHPSVDAQSCGAHFWLRDGRITWSP